jgi:hypothetical protein
MKGTDLYCSVAGDQRAPGIPAGGGRADTPAGGGQAAFRRALFIPHYGWKYVLALWGKRDTEGAPTRRQGR